MHDSDETVYLSDFATPFWFMSNPSSLFKTQYRHVFANAVNVDIAISGRHGVVVAL